MGCGGGGGGGGGGKQVGGRVVLGVCWSRRVPMCWRTRSFLCLFAEPTRNTVGTAPVKIYMQTVI
jgi:hypothetical protein